MPDRRPARPTGRRRSRVPRSGRTGHRRVRLRQAGRPGQRGAVDRGQARSTGLAAALERSSEAWRGRPCALSDDHRLRSGRRPPPGGRRRPDRPCAPSDDHCPPARPGGRRRDPAPVQALRHRREHPPMIDSDGAQRRASWCGIRREGLFSVRHRSRSRKLQSRGRGAATPDRRVRGGPAVAPAVTDGRPSERSWPFPEDHGLLTAAILAVCRGSAMIVGSARQERGARSAQERTGAHRSAQERTGAHRSAQECTGGRRSPRRRRSVRPPLRRAATGRSPGTAPASSRGPTRAPRGDRGGRSRSRLAGAPRAAVAARRAGPPRRSRRSPGAAPRPGTGTGRVGRCSGARRTPW